MFDKFEAAKHEEQSEMPSWRSRLAPLKVPKDLDVIIMPSGNLVAARLIVGKNNLPRRKWVSVYLDLYDTLGCVGEPYWEAFPIGGDTERFLVGHESKMFDSIRSELRGFDEEGKNNDV